MAGGFGTSSILADCELFTSAGAWIATEPLNKARWYHTATRLRNGQVLVVGGFDQYFQYLASAELFQPPPGLPFLSLLLDS